MQTSTLWHGLGVRFRATVVCYNYGRSMTKNSKKKVDVGLVAQTNIGATHSILFPSAILAVIVGILVTLVAASLPTIIVRALAAVVLVIVLVVVLNNKTRYATVVFLRELPQRLAATKTYGDKKPANHDD